MQLKIIQAIAEENGLYYYKENKWIKYFLLQAIKIISKKR